MHRLTRRFEYFEYCVRIPLPSVLSEGTEEVVSVEAMLEKGKLDYDFGIALVKPDLLYVN